MSRMALALILAAPILAAPILAAPAPAIAAPALTAEQAMANYRANFTPAEDPRCAPSGNPDEIIVCAQRPRDEPRSPLPFAPEPGERVAGNAASGMAAMNNDGCLKLCQQPVGIGLSISADGIRVRLNGE